MNETEKMFLCFMADKGLTQMSDLLKEINKSAGYFSPYREKMIKNRILESPARGVVTFALPRFSAFVKTRIKLEDRRSENNYLLV